METEEIQLIDHAFLSIKTRIIEFFSLKKNQDKDDLYKELLLITGFHNIYGEIPSEILSLPLDEYVLEKLDDLIDELEKEISVKKQSKRMSVSLKSKREEYWLSLKTLLSDTSKEVSEEIYNDILKDDLPNDGLILNRAQISLLMLYLRKRKAIKDFNDIQLANRFSGLTGYSYKQLRLKVVGSAKSERNLITQKKEDYLKLKLLLECIITDIEQDMKKAQLV